MSHDTPTHNSQDKKPTFNVVVPFERVTVVQMNRLMANVLADFILEFDDIDVEMYALAEHLRDPGSWHRRASGAAFSVDQFGGVVNLNINQTMLDTIIEYLGEANSEEVEIFALNRALIDPVRCYELRVKKFRQRNGDPSNDPRQNRRQHNRQNYHGGREPAYS